MAALRFRTRQEIRNAYPLDKLFDDLLLYIENSTLEKAKSLTINKTQLKAFVQTAKVYALNTPAGKADRYDVFSVLFKEIDKCTNGKPKAGITSSLNTWSLDEQTILYMFSTYYKGE